MKVIAIIPARGGSKAIPRKNIKKLCGKPLIAYIIETALKVGKIDRVIVSTDDKEIAEIARKYGAEVPFIRPEELARDKIPTLPVLQHAVRYLEEKKGYTPDIIVLLYATSPLVGRERISEAIKMLKNGEYDSILSVVEDRGHYWLEKNGKYGRMYPKIIKNRQITKPLLKENGAIYVYRRDILMKGNVIDDSGRGLLIMGREESIDIDEPLDFEFAEFLLKRRENDKN